jgi:hypothetical protein
MYMQNISRQHKAPGEHMVPEPFNFDPCYFFSDLLSPYTVRQSSSCFCETITASDPIGSIHTSCHVQKENFILTEFVFQQRSTTLPEHITAYMIEAPVVNNEVHYRTIGNQACAELLQEVRHVSISNLT